MASTNNDNRTMSEVEPPIRKRNIVTKMFLAIAVIVVALVVLVAMQPADFRVTRTATMSAPPAAVFAQVNDFHNWETWSPWAKLDRRLRCPSRARPREPA